MYLLTPILKNLLKQKSTLLLILVAMFPLLIIITTSNLFETNFMQLEGPKNTMSGLGFWAAIISTQHQFVFSFIILAFIAVMMFYDEIESGRLIVFKDNPRSKVFFAKCSAIVILFIGYFVLISFTSLLSYFITADKITVSSGSFFPASSKETQSIFVEIIGYFLTEIVGISISFAVAIVLPSGYTILVMIFYQLVNMLSPQLSSVKYMFPIGYSKLDADYSSVTIILLMLLVTLIWCISSIVVGRHLFNKVEF